MSFASANGALHTSVTDFGKDSVWVRLAEKVRSIFPHKTAENLAACTNLQIRSCEFFLSRKSMLNSDAVVSLLDTEHGPEVLVALLDHSQQPWVQDFKTMWQIDKLNSAKADLDRRIEALEKLRRK